MDYIKENCTDKNILICVTVFIVIVLILWYVLMAIFVKPHHVVVNENFNDTQVLKVDENNEVVDKNLPFVDPKTGTLIDGPGYEQGEIEGITQDAFSKIPSNYYFLDDGADGEMSIQHNLCSKSCCSEQWPTPFKQKYDPYVCGNKDKFVPSNIFCNNTFQDSGCLCLSKDQSRFLMDRGTNGNELF